jgi:5'-methylthioadenosine phosphorylase
LFLTTFDFNNSSNPSFYDDAPVTHVDMSLPFCLEIRELLVKNLEKCGEEAGDSGVIACTEGPRLETPAEIEMFRRLGCDLVGMTVVPEVVLARKLEMCYTARALQYVLFRTWLREFKGG